MKPLNLDNRPCSPVSSNCVIWQGPDIECINICNGDSVSDVVAALATELCTILDQTNVSNYDLSCLGITACGPKDIQALIQLLIDKICELNNITPDDTRGTGTCPDCVVTVAPCFQTGNVVTMQLLDYVQMIAGKVCNIIDQITIINSQINDILIRLEELENTVIPDSPIPSFTLGCNIGVLSNGSTQFINVVLQEFINNVWCSFYNATGTTADLISAVDAICIEDGDLQLTTGTTFSSNPNWVTTSSYNNVADAINNIWVALCDIFTYVSEGSLTAQDTNSVDLNFNSGVLTANIVDTGWKDLNGFTYYTGSMANAKPQCRRIGNQIHFRGTVILPIADGTGGIQALTSDTSYYNVYRATPFVGNNGIVYDSENRILLNSNGISAQSVIPTTVVGATTNLDNAYQAPQLAALRKISVEQDLGNGITGVINLTAAINLVILPNKTLRITSLSSLEQDATNMTSFEGSSLFRNITSSFTPRSRVIDFRNFTPTYDGNMSINQSPLTGIATSNSLTVGRLYMIKDYTPGDDFTNVGAASNGVGQSFIATGISATVWTTSQLIPITSALHSDGFNNILGGTQWPAIVDLTGSDFDAGRPENLGGFAMKLDGLIAYLDPCNTDIKSYDCGKGEL